MTTVPFKPEFGAFVLESLTLGMYGESRNAIREYVQNSFDSLRQAVHEKLLKDTDVRVEVTLDEKRDSLTIRDNGMGLRSENAVTTLASVGASNKDYRSNAGFRGIGRLSGIVFCDRLTFSTKAAGQTQKTVVIFKAKELREKLSPESNNPKDAATTLESCVEASVEDVSDLDDHFFEVHLSGFYNPPVECQDVATLRSFLSQVSPLPYDPTFSFEANIRAKATAAGFPIEWIRLFVRDGASQFEEVYKPYGADFGVKRERIKLSAVDFVSSPTGKWWGWVGRKRISGGFKDLDSRGIRVRVRNIQIDDTKVIRDIFAVSRLGSKPRSSYARFAEWYVGEIFVDPKAAIPNARRDGFEESHVWHRIRDELDDEVATRYGKLAYKTSTSDQLSLDTLNRRLDELKKGADPLVSAPTGDWDRVSQSVAEANDLQRRIALAVKAADETELAPLRELSETVASVKRGLNSLIIQPPAATECQEEIAAALSELTQRIYKEFKRRLAPAEWRHAREVLREVTGAEPE
jgi:Histidine kinase-, DNA gyrase B-, and HSP90-like ATPase